MSNGKLSWIIRYFGAVKLEDGVSGEKSNSVVDKKTCKSAQSQCRDQCPAF